MPKPRVSLQKRIAEEVSRTVSPREGVLAARAMRMLATHAGPGEKAFLCLSAHNLEEAFVARGISDATIRRYLSTICWIYEIATRWDLIRKNPAAEIVPPKVPPLHPDFSVDSTLADIVIAHCSAAVRLDSTRRIAFRTLSKLALVYVVSSGAFLAEVTEIRCKDLHSDGLVVGRKYRKRKLFLSKEALVALRKYRSVRQSGTALHGDAALFVTESGKPTYFGLVWKLLNKVIKEAGVAEFGLTPAKLQRSSVRSVADAELDWLVAFSMGGYREIPNITLKPYTTDELAEFIDRFHPMSSSREAR